jgi:hypothetical protein
LTDGRSPDDRPGDLVYGEVRYQIVDRESGEAALINHTFADRAIAEQCAADLTKLVNQYLSN